MKIERKPILLFGVDGGGLRALFETSLAKQELPTVSHTMPKRGPHAYP